ncbi:RRM domain-containing protein [Aphelenchoides besseyi]|nr:RRM domain-containing protein [Aphelenchoides besseyi]
MLGTPEHPKSTESVHKTANRVHVNFSRKIESQEDKILAFCFDCTIATCQGILRKLTVGPKMSTDDPLLNGQPISSLKVVELRKELEIRGLSKSGVKKDLFERLRDHLKDKPIDFEAEDEPPVGSRLSTSPRKSPTKPTSPVMNKFVAQYLQNQQATLQEHRRDAQSTSSGEEKPSEETTVFEAEEPTEKKEPPKSPKKPNEKKSAEKIEAKQIKPKEDIQVESNPQKSPLKIREASPVLEDTQSKEESQVELSPQKSFHETELIPKTESPQPTSQQSTRKSREASPSVEDSKPKEIDQKPEQPQEVLSSPKRSRETSPVVEAKNEPIQESDKPNEKPRKRPLIVFDIKDTPAAPPTSRRKITPPEVEVPVRPVLRAVEVSEKPKNAIGLERKREPSPARKTPSQFIHIFQLRRPFSHESLLDMLGTFGDFSREEFWIDKLRSNCIVKYDSVETAQKVRDELHNSRWPPASDMTLRVDFTTDEVLQRRRNESGNANAKKDGRGIVIHVKNERRSSPSAKVVYTRERSQEKSGSSQDEADRRTKRGLVKEIEFPSSASESPLPTIDRSYEKLFRKTDAKPQIYWLPLNEEQAEKRANARKEAQKSAPSRRRSRSRSPAFRKRRFSPPRRVVRNSSPPRRRRISRSPSVTHKRARAH